MENKETSKSFLSREGFPAKGKNFPCQEKDLQASPLCQGKDLQASPPCQGGLGGGSLDGYKLGEIMYLLWEDIKLSILYKHPL